MTFQKAAPIVIALKSCEKKIVQAENAFVSWRLSG